jgi:hypothetical protein
MDIQISNPGNIARNGNSINLESVVGLRVEWFCLFGWRSEKKS